MKINRLVYLLAHKIECIQNLNAQNKYVVFLFTTSINDVHHIDDTAYSIHIRSFIHMKYMLQSNMRMFTFIHYCNVVLVACVSQVSVSGIHTYTNTHISSTHWLNTLKAKEHTYCIAFACVR